jgi:hypothetical protein
MTKVSTTTFYVDLDGDYGSVDGFEVTCGRCGHSGESFGTDEPSLRRCAYLLHENCPRAENNYYDVGS